MDKPIPFVWKPTALRATLAARAELAAKARDFLQRAGYLEVATPTISRAVDPHGSFPIEVMLHSFEGGRFFLHTSPELSLKRLVAAGFGPVFEFSRSYRDEASSPLHNVEFTMLEWYRPEGDYRDVMREVGQFMDALTGCGLPHELPVSAIVMHRERGLPPSLLHEMQTMRALDDPGFAREFDTLTEADIASAVGAIASDPRPIAVTDFPVRLACQAAVRDEGVTAVAERFEVYWKSQELANGYQELRDPIELEARLQMELRELARCGRHIPELPVAFLAAHESFPRCAGVGLGFDRFALCAMGLHDLRDILPFPLDIA